MIATDPEHGTREWSEDPVNDLLEMYKTLKEISERIQKDLESFLTALEPLWERPGRTIRNKRRRRICRIQPKLHLNTVPLGTATYLYKAKEMKNLARSTKTGAACRGGVKNEQCRHTFEITRAQCAPCAGYNAECMDYEKNDAADTKHRPGRNT